MHRISKELRIDSLSFYCCMGEEDLLADHIQQSMRHPAHSGGIWLPSNFIQLAASKLPRLTIHAILKHSF